MLIAWIDAKILEDQQEDENVVEAERFFYEVAGEKFDPRPATMRNENPCAKTERERDPSDAFGGGLGQGNSLCSPVQQPQIERQQERDAGVKGNPKRPGAHLGRALFRASHCGRNPQLMEFCASMLGLAALKLESSTRAVSPRRTVTGKSQFR